MLFNGLKFQISATIEKEKCFRIRVKDKWCFRFFDDDKENGYGNRILVQDLLHTCLTLLSSKHKIIDYFYRMASATTSSKDGGISAETSKRVCSHMNDDHAVSVYAMAKAMLQGSAGTKITSATLKSVSLEGCDIAVVTCTGDLCEMKQFTFPFVPPLKSGSEIRPRMVEIHKQVCAPQISWLFTHPDALAVLIVCALLGYGTHVVGVEELSANIEGNATINSILSVIFGSAAFFSRLVKYAWIFAVVAHAGEGLYVAHQAQHALKLEFKSRLLWFGMVCCVGFPITKEFLDLLNVHQKNSSKEAKGH